MAVALCIRFPFLKTLLLGYFYRESPFCVPYLPPQPKADESDGKVFQRLGYKKLSAASSDQDVNSYETPDVYLERTQGLISFYAALCVVNGPNNSNPFGVERAWTWCARYVNMKPISISGPILRVFLEIAGPALLKAYPIQFPKLLDVTKTEFFAMLPTKPTANHSNFKTYISEFLDTKKFRSQEVEDWITPVKWNPQDFT